MEVNGIITSMLEEPADEMNKGPSQPNVKLEWDFVESSEHSSEQALNHGSQICIKDEPSIKEEPLDERDMESSEASVLQGLYVKEEEGVASKSEKSLTKNETLMKKKEKYLQDQFAVEHRKLHAAQSGDAAGDTEISKRHEDEVMDKHSRTSATSNKKKKRDSKPLITEDFNQSILDIERQKIQFLMEKSSRNQNNDADEDLMFFKSLLPHVKRIPVAQKLAFRGRIQEIVQQFAYQVPIITPHPHIYGSSATASVSNPQVSPHSYTNSSLEPHPNPQTPLDIHSCTHSSLEPQNVPTDSYNDSVF